MSEVNLKWRYPPDLPEDGDHIVAFVKSPLGGEECHVIVTLNLRREGLLEEIERWVPYKEYTAAFNDKHFGPSPLDK